MGDTTTRGVRIQVKSAYLPDPSAPVEGRYLFAYRVRISNLGDETVQLISREWIITDQDGEVLAHTLTKPFPAELRLANQVPQGESRSLRLVTMDHDSIHDIAVPIDQNGRSKITLAVLGKQIRIRGFEESGREPELRESGLQVLGEISAQRACLVQILAFGLIGDASIELG